ncbi:MAG: zinc metallopeptidase [Planctomycetota bacterium]|jgi:Zn-dependent membrane protease YugP
MFFFDPVWMMITLGGLGASLWAQARVKSTFAKYDRVGVRAGMTGAQAAAAVCRAGGANDVRIEQADGFLSDHYDPREKTLRLSPAVYGGQSVSAIAVAAHEAGHAIQDVREYAWLGFRSRLVPVVSFGNQAWPMVLMLGMFLTAVAPRFGQVAIAGAIVLFATVVLFQLITLPVEFDASNRAKAVLASTGIVANADEARGVEDVLGAAAMTYVASAATSVIQLLYLVFRLLGSRD